jgi:hypothetical protein
MRKFFIFLICLFISTPAYCGSFTSNYRLEIPEDDSLDWSGIISDDINSIDTVLSILSDDVAAYTSDITTNSTNIATMDAVVYRTNLGIISGDSGYIQFDPNANDDADIKFYGETGGNYYNLGIAFENLDATGWNPLLSISGTAPNSNTDSYIGYRSDGLWKLRANDQDLLIVWTSDTGVNVNRYVDAYGLLRAYEGIDMADSYVTNVKGITVDTVSAETITCDYISTDQISVNIEGVINTPNTPLSSDVAVDGTISGDTYHFDVLSNSPDVVDNSPGMYVSPDAAGGSSLLFYDGSSWRKVNLI